MDNGRWKLEVGGRRSGCIIHRKEAKNAKKLYFTFVVFAVKKMSLINR